MQSIFSYDQSGLFIPLKPFIAGKPIITLPFTVVETVKEHLLSCTAIGAPPIQVKLFKDNILLASDISTVYSRWTETATYTCFANNSFGADSRDFKVTLLGKCSTGPYWTNTYMLFTGREVRIGKNCGRGLEYRPRADLGRWITFFFFFFLRNRKNKIKL